MTFPSTGTLDRKVLWAQVCALALMQGAIALLWVIYNLYLVDLLVRLGFSSAMATGLLVVENLLAMMMEPLMGSLSDRLQHQIGTRFPLISLGSILSAGLFVGLPTVVFWGADAGLRWILPSMMVAWAMAMTVFRSPALSLLGRYAFGTGLPQAASILTLVGGVAGAMGPLASSVILGWGPVVAFLIGSVVLLVAAAMLWIAGPNKAVLGQSEQTSGDAANLLSLNWSSLALVFGAGLGITFGFRSLMLLFSRVSSQVSGGSGSIIIGSVFVALAATAIPAGILATRLGNRRAMVLGLAALSLVCVLVGIAQQPLFAVVLAILFGAAFSLVSNGTIPFALSAVPAHKAGLGTGIFFSGATAAAALFGAIAGRLQDIPYSIGTVLGIAAFLLAGISIAAKPPRSLAP